MKKLLSAMLALIMLACSPAAAVCADGSPFSDVKEKRWSYESIVYAYENGLMDGVAALAEPLARLITGA